MSTGSTLALAGPRLVAARLLTASLVACAAAPAEGDASTAVASSRASGTPVDAAVSASVPSAVSTSSVAPSPGPPLVPRSTAKCGTEPVEIGGWVEVPAATYTMGKVTDRARLARNVKDPDSVIESIVFLEPVATAVARFWIGRAEVTVGEYARCVAAGGCTAPAKGGVHDLAGNGREWTSTGDEQTRVSKGMACDGEIACYAFNRFVNQFVEEQLDYLGFPLRAQ